jgi:protease I
LEFDALVFVGGSGAARFLDDEDIYRILEEAKDMVIGAICIAPAILAKNGILKGKRATVWSNNMDKGLIGILEENGAIYENSSVVVDEKIITANGPMAAKEFAEKVLEVLDND